MNDPTVQHGTGLSTAIVDLKTTEDEPIRWSFPVVTGTSHEHCVAGIRERLLQNPAVDMTTVRVTYPAGPWNQPLDRDIPVIGTVPVNPPPSRPTTPPPSNPPKREWDMGPLPEVNQRQPAEQQAAADLDVMLIAWSQKHQLSSAEYYLFLSRALATHAMRLVSLERRPQRRSANG